MKYRLLFIGILLLNLASLAISLQQFWNMGIYIDEHNTTTSAILGGDIMVLLNWAILAFLLFAVILAGIGAIMKKQ